MGVKAFSSNPFMVFRWQKAKKEYHCRNCNKLILQGDRYFRLIGKCDFTGQFYDIVYCEKCGHDKISDYDI